MPSESALSYRRRVGSDDGQAPTLSVPPVEIVAVEHPMVVKNLDNALKTFGRGQPFKQMLDPACADDILPLYLRPNDPFCAVLESHVTPTSNVVLKITVPKRTGRKRKRGSQGPFIDAGDSDSLARLDASTVFRTLNDNVGNYQVEPLGVVNITHRYRGMADFQKSSTSSPFMTRVKEQLLSGNVETFKSFKFNPDRGFKINEDVVPPPFFSESNLPYPWTYQRGHELTEGQDVKGTHSRIKGAFSYDLSLPIPTKRKKEPPERLVPLVNRLAECFEVRPIWTKRALENYLGNHKLHGEVKMALHFVSYQFHGGPWRDASIKFGVDPRKDPKCRIYQTFVFKILRVDNPDTLRFNWVMSDFGDDAVQRRKWESHKFDGKGFCMDGRIWQACDITDPLISKVLATDTIREVPELKQDGWFCNGTQAKARGIMRTKIRALQTGKKLTDEDFEDAMSIPDDVVLTDEVKGISVPLPDVAIIQKIGDEEWHKTKKRKNARDMNSFRMNHDHGSKRGKRLDAITLQDAIPGDSMEIETNKSVRQSIETGNDAMSLGSAMGDEGNILDEDEEGDVGDDDDEDEDEDSLDFHDDSSVASDSDNEGEGDDGGMTPPPPGRWNKATWLGLSH